jgi:hypothetical protein
MAATPTAGAAVMRYLLAAALTCDNGGRGRSSKGRLKRSEARQQRACEGVGRPWHALSMLSSVCLHRTQLALATTQGKGMPPKNAHNTNARKGWCAAAPQEQQVSQALLGRLSSPR